MRALGLLLVVSLLAMFTQASDDRLREPVPSSVLFSGFKFGEFKLSPSGKYLLIKHWKMDGSSISVYDIPNKKIKYNFKVDKEYKYRDITWLSDEVIAYEKNGYIVKMESSGSNLEVMVNRVIDKKGSYEDRRYKYWNLGGLIPGDKGEVLLEASSDDKSLLYAYNFRTGEKRLLADGRALGVSDWYVDSLGVPRVGLKETKKERQYFWFDSESGELNPVLSPSKKPLVFNKKEREKHRYQIIGYAPKSNNIYIAENRSTGYYRLVELDPKTGDIVRVIKEKAGVDIGWASDVVIEVRPELGVLTGIRYRDDLGWQQEWFDKDYERIQKILDKKQPELKNLITSCDRGLNFCNVEALNTTDTYIEQVLDVANGQLISVAKFAKERTGYVLNQPEAYQFKTPETTLYGITTNTTAANDNPPVILIPCPGLESNYAVAYNSYAQFFATRGFTVHQTNNRGCSGRGVDYLYGKQGELPQYMADDLVATVEWVHSQPRYQDSKIFLFSYTWYSSFTAGLALKRKPELFSGAALFSAPLNPKAYYKYLKKNDYWYARNFWDSLAADGKLKGADFERLSVYDELAKTKIPVLLTYGRDDATPIAENLEKLSELSKANGNLDVRALKDTSLKIGLDAMEIYYAESAERTFRKALGGG